MNHPAIHPTAIVSPEAHIESDVTVGPFSVIDGPVRIGKGCKIDGHVSLRGRTTIGENCVIGWGSVIGADPQDLHFDAATDSGVVMGDGNVLREYVTVHRSTQAGGMTRMGSGNFLMTGVHLAHDVTMGDNNVLANNVLLAGHITVGKKVFLGGAAGFHQFIHIGDYAIVQGNAAISQDVPPYCMAYGINALAGLNVIGMKRAGFAPELRSEIKQVFRQLLCSGSVAAGLRDCALKKWSAEAQVLVDAVAAPSRKGVITRGQSA